nr:4-hydroxy-3-methylbut-2-enyl diphosphate reductase (EC 1.17.1.2) [Kibdelosporangium sp. MJ126-NF4]
MAAEELIVTSFVHPRRGHVHCPAGPAVTGHLRRLGHQARLGSSAMRPQLHQDGGTLFTASYLDRSGMAVGIGVAANNTDDVALQAAADAVATWSAIWRTRRVLMATPRCSCASAMADSRHSHCPLMAWATSETARFAERGDQVVIIGKHDDTPAQALLARTREAIIVESPSEVASLHLDPERVAYIISPGTIVEMAARVIAALRARYPAIRGMHPDGLCYAASDWAATALTVISACDVALVLTSPGNAANASYSGRTPVHVIDSVDHIEPNWLANAESVGLILSASAPVSLQRETVTALSGLGPLSLAQRKVSTEVSKVDMWLSTHTTNSPLVHPIVTL